MLVKLRRKNKIECMPGEVSLISVLRREQFFSARTHAPTGDIKSSAVFRAMGAGNGGDARSSQIHFLPGQRSFSPTGLHPKVIFNVDDYG